LNLALWIVAGLPAAVLLISTSKAFVPREKIVAVAAPLRNGSKTSAPVPSGPSQPSNSWPAAVLILPAALDIAPILVTLAASGAALLFIGAVTMRLRGGERGTIVPDLPVLVSRSTLDEETPRCR
jgi:hypothetical protein